MRPIVARDLMTPDVLGVGESWTIQETARYLVDHEISGAVVRNESGAIVGVVSLTDIAAVAADEGSHLTADRRTPNFYMRGWDEQLDPSELDRMHFTDPKLVVGEVMTPDVFSVNVEDLASDVAQTMLESHIHRVLVEEKDEVIGVITTSDLLGLLVKE